jgi:glutaminase
VRLPLPPESLTEPPVVSTGTLPPPDQVAKLVDEALSRYATENDGTVADYIPALAEASPDLFGISVTGVTGRTHAAGDADTPFSIQSISKPFVFALVCDAVGYEAAQEFLGVNSTGLPFDSVMAIELNRDRTGNPMVNAGAIATTSLSPGETHEARWDFVREGLSRFAGRDLTLDEEVYVSESATNARNRGIARLLDGYRRIHGDPDDAVEIYTRQCALTVTARDLSVMGATLADGGVNPVTGVRVIDARTCWRVLAVMSTAGLYERSGDWLYEIGLPGKSGVSGGIVTISPGKGGLGTYSPPLDRAGNSVRGQLVARYLSDRLGLNIFLSRDVQNR